MRAALMILMVLAPAAARGADVLVVLNKPLAPSYREAFDGIRAQWGEAIETASAGRPLPSGPHGVIVALGAHAAARARSGGAPVVAALAPAYRSDGREPAVVRVAMTPSPERFVSLLAAAGVHHLLALRAVPADPDFSRRAAAAGEKTGVVIEDRILSAPENLPQLLRGEGEGSDAVWLAPDPLIVTAETLGIAREYSRARGIPFFAPAAGLVADDIRGDLTVSFRDCGREAARAAKDILAGRAVAKIVYPEPGGGETPGMFVISSSSRAGSSGR